jgi:hypothetical protein
MKWQELAAMSHDQTAIAGKQALQEGEITRDLAPVEVCREEVFEAPYSLEAD